MSTRRTQTSHLRTGINLHTASPHFHPFDSGTGMVDQLASFFQHAHHAGIDGVEITTDHVCGLAQSDLDTLRQQLESYKLQLVVNHLEHFVLPYDTDSGAVEDTLEALRMAKRLGARVVSLATGFRGGSVHRMRTERVKQLGDVLCRLVEASSGMQIMLGLENDGDLQPVEIEWLMQAVASPRLGVTLNIGNERTLACNPLEHLLVLAPFVVNVHLTDCYVRPDDYGRQIVECMMHNCVVDLAKAASILRATGRSVQISVDMPTMHEHPEQRVQEYVTYLKQAIAQA